jgi:hypothetical protein
MSRCDDDAVTRETVPRFYTALPSTRGELVADVVLAGRRASEGVLRRMLRTEAWRERRVGAWLAIGRPDLSLGDAVLESLRTSRGGYTAPSLIAAAIELVGEEAVPALLDHGRADEAHSWHGGGLVTVALRHLGAGEPGPFAEPTERDLVMFAGHRACAAAIAGEARRR